MAGTAITPPPAAGMDIAAGQALTSSYVNSFRISAVAERLAMHVHSTPKTDAVEFFNLCLSLARGIDYAVANNEVPGRAHELPFLLKQVCQHKNDPLLQAALMVLMISVKNACKIGWFSDEDSKELLSLANEIGSSFCSVREINTEASSSLPTISKIMSRFYPRLKMGQILAFLEVKPGYGTFVIDFHISKNTKSSPADKIRLFVAQTDNIETSSCIASPPQVNFLINGKGVERRTNVIMDTGPQMPTIVTPMLKYGTNLLQAVGQFNGNYIIVIAFMSVISNLECPVLQNYDQPAVAAPDSDSDIIEGPSRISLNCPISFRRIETPVKGHSCKHCQCFDFDNFVDINSRRPSWRCPHCNQYVCYTDIRVDQNMAKVLREVGENVADVIISADGSWKAVMESNDHKDQSHDKTSNCQPNGPTQQESTNFKDAVPDILDLTEGDDGMDVMGTCETEDRKPLLSNLQSQFNVTNLTIPTDASEVNRNNASPIEDDFWSGIFLSTYGLGTSSARSDVVVGGSEPAPTNFMLSPVLTDAVSPALNREPETFRGTALLATSALQIQISATNNLQLQQSQFANSIVSNEYGRFPSIPRHVNRTPIAVQALPAQTLTTVPQQRSRNSFNNLIPNGPSVASQSSALPSIADGFNSVSSNVERQQQFSRSHLHQFPVSHMTSSSLQQHSAPQIWDFQDHLQAPSQLPSANRVSSALPTAQHNSRQQQPPNPRMHASQSPSLVRLSAQSSVPFQRTQVHQGGTQSGVGHTAVSGSSQHARLMVAAQRAAQMARQSETVPVPIQTSRTSSFPVNVDGFRASVGEQRGSTGVVQPVTRADGLVDLQADQNWRPTGRMRGSLSGRAYSAALNQFIIQPTQPVQAARPPSNMTLPLPGIPSALHVLMANNRNAHAPQVVNYPSTEPASMAGGSGVLPEQSSGMQ
uniref:Putative E3 SUMO-protein ligase pli1 n=1 Tax=Davidia involucrata TaxID=16924 RepID=A0A5B7AMW3_DAVIN